MTEIDYVLYSLMIYATSFIFVYVSQAFYDVYIEVVKKYRSLFGGAVFGISLSLVIFIVEILHLTGLPDGRFTIVMLSTSFFGLIGGLITMALVLLSSLLNNYYEITFLVCNLTQHFALGMIIYFINKKSGKLHLLLNVIGSVIGIGFAGFLARMTVRVAYEFANDINRYILYIIPLVAIFSASISVEIIGEDRKRLRHNTLKKNKNALEVMNKEIIELNTQLLDSQNKNRLLRQASDEGFVEYNHYTKVLNMSERTLQILDHMLLGHEVTLWDVFEVLDPSDAKRIQDNFNNLKSNKDDMFDISLKTRTQAGDYKHIRFTGVVIRQDKRIASIVGTIKDIHSQVLKEEMIFNLAYKDDETDLFNENAFFKDLAEQKQKGNNENLVFFSIKGFQTYSTIGMEFKNRLRQYLASVIKGYYYVSNCYYLQDGTFAVRMIKDVSFEESLVKYNAIIHDLKKPINIGDISVPIVLQATFLRDPYPNNTVEGILIRALSMLSYLEENNILTLTPFDETVYSARFRMNNLDSYILSGLNNAEFYMMYQPQYDSNCQISGYESLIRWQSSQYGFVSPGEFIPIAEKYGSIYHIGLYVIRKTCGFMKDYYRVFGQYPRVAINVSFVELINPGYSKTLIGIVNEYKIPKNKMVVEITETAISEFKDIVLKNISKLSQQGFEVHLDDFGTGYSSLAHLSMLNVDSIKIDKSFVDHIVCDENIRSIVLSTIELAHRIGIKVIAEGIEEKEQFLILQQLSCDEYQGFYFSKPLNDHVILSEN